MSPHIPLYFGLQLDEIKDFNQNQNPNIRLLKVHFRPSTDKINPMGQKFDDFIYINIDMPSSSQNTGVVQNQNNDPVRQLFATTVSRVEHQATNGGNETRFVSDKHVKIVVELFDKNRNSIDNVDATSTSSKVFITEVLDPTSESAKITLDVMSKNGTKICTLVFTRRRIIASPDALTAAEDAATTKNAVHGNNSAKPGWISVSCGPLQGNDDFNHPFKYGVQLSLPDDADHLAKAPLFAGDPNDDDESIFSSSSPWLLKRKDASTSSIASVHRQYADLLRTESLSFEIELLMDPGVAAESLTDHSNTKTSVVSSPSEAPSCSAECARRSGDNKTSSNFFIPVTVKLSSLAAPNTAGSLANKTETFTVEFPSYGTLQVSVSVMFDAADFERQKLSDHLAFAQAGVQSVLDAVGQDGQVELATLLDCWTQKLKNTDLKKDVLSKVTDFTSSWLRNRSLAFSTPSSSPSSSSLSVVESFFITSANDALGLVSSASSLLPEFKSQLENVVKSGLEVLKMSSAVVQSITSVLQNVPYLGPLIAAASALLDLYTSYEDFQPVIRNLTEKIRNIISFLHHHKDEIASQESFVVQRARAVRRVAAACYDIITSYQNKCWIFRVCTADGVRKLLEQCEERLEGEANLMMNMFAISLAIDTKEKIGELRLTIEDIKEKVQTFRDEMNTNHKQICEMLEVGGAMLKSVDETVKDNASMLKTIIDYMQDILLKNGSIDNQQLTAAAAATTDSSRDFDKQKFTNDLQQLLRTRYPKRFTDDNLKVTFDELYVNLKIFKTSKDHSTAVMDYRDDQKKKMNNNTNTPHSAAAVKNSSSPSTSKVVESQQQPILCTSAEVSEHIDETVVTLVDSPAGSGKTTFCKSLCIKQPSDRFICVFVVLRELIETDRLRGVDGCAPIDSVKELLKRCHKGVIYDDEAELIVKHDIPVLFVLDGFDEVEGLISSPATDDSKKQTLCEFLKHFVDPTNRAQHRKYDQMKHLVRSCDAVLVTSREDRINRDICNLDVPVSEGNMNRWLMEFWTKENIVDYCTKFFRSVANNPDLKTHRESLPSLVSSHLIDHTSHFPFRGLPLFVNLLCTNINNGMVSPDEIRQTTPSSLFELNLLSYFKRDKENKLEKLFGRKLSEKDVKNCCDMCVKHVSKLAFEQLIVESGSLMILTPAADDFIGSPPNEPTWLEIMLKLDLLRKSVGDNKFQLYHRMFAEFFAARFVAQDVVPSAVPALFSPTCSALDRLPFKAGFRTPWLLLIDIVKRKASHPALTEEVVTKSIVQKLRATWKNLPAKKRLGLEESRTDGDFKKRENDLPLRLITEVTLVLDHRRLLAKLDDQWIGYPAYYAKIAELCGEFAALDTLKWLVEKCCPKKLITQSVLETCMVRATQRQVSVNTKPLIEFLAGRGIEISLEVAIELGAKPAIAKAVQKAGEDTICRTCFKFLVCNDYESLMVMLCNAPAQYSNLFWFRALAVYTKSLPECPAKTLVWDESNNEFKDVKISDALPFSDFNNNIRLTACDIRMLVVGLQVATPVVIELLSLFDTHLMQRLCWRALHHLMETSSHSLDGTDASTQLLVLLLTHCSSKHRLLDNDREQFWFAAVAYLANTTIVPDRIPVWNSKAKRMIMVKKSVTYPFKDCQDERKIKTTRSGVDFERILADLDTALNDESTHPLELLVKGFLDAASIEKLCFTALARRDPHLPHFLLEQCSCQYGQHFWFVAASQETRRLLGQPNDHLSAMCKSAHESIVEDAVRTLTLAMQMSVMSVVLNTVQLMPEKFIEALCWYLIRSTMDRDTDRLLIFLLTHAPSEFNSSFWFTSAANRANLKIFDTEDEIPVWNVVENKFEEVPKSSTFPFSLSWKTWNIRRGELVTGALNPPKLDASEKLIFCGSGIVLPHDIELLIQCEKRTKILKRCHRVELALDKIDNARQTSATVLQAMIINNAPVHLFQIVFSLFRENSINFGDALRRKGMFHYIVRSNADNTRLILNECEFCLSPDEFRLALVNGGSWLALAFEKQHLSPRTLSLLIDSCKRHSIDSIELLAKNAEMMKNTNLLQTAVKCKIPFLSLHMLLDFLRSDSLTSMLTTPDEKGDTCLHLFYCVNLDVGRLIVSKFSSSATFESALKVKNEAGKTPWKVASDRYYIKDVLALLDVKNSQTASDVYEECCRLSVDRYKELSSDLFSENIN